MKKPLRHFSQARATDGTWYDLIWDVALMPTRTGTPFLRPLPELKLAEVRWAGTQRKVPAPMIPMLFGVEAQDKLRRQEEMQITRTGIVKP